MVRRLAAFLTAAAALQLDAGRYPNVVLIVDDRVFAVLVPAL